MNAQDIDIRSTHFKLMNMHKLRLIRYCFGQDWKSQYNYIFFISRQKTTLCGSFNMCLSKGNKTSFGISK